MDKIAEKVLEYLKTSGKTSGGVVKDKLGLRDSEYRAAKKVLKEANLVTLGRGRGGTIEAIDGAEPPPEPRKLSKAEIMEGARAEKEAKSKSQKHHDFIKKTGEAVAKKEFPDSETEVWVIDANREIYHIWVWDENKKAKLYKGQV